MDNAPLALDQLDLPVLKMDDPHFGEDPLPRFAEARKQHPWLAKTDLGVVVTEYKAMRACSAATPNCGRLTRTSSACWAWKARPGATSPSGR
jgi:hypothetical protein